MGEGVGHRECLVNRYSYQPLSEARPLAVAWVRGSIAKSIRENVRKLRATYWRRTYLDGMSDGFWVLLPDMFKWDPGPSFMTGSA